MECKHYKTTVTDSRPIHSDMPNYSYGQREYHAGKAGALILRRRRCLDCRYSFITYELTKEEFDKKVYPDESSKLGALNLLAQIDAFLKSVQKELQ